jgi:UbiD family decarboxylase
MTVRDFREFMVLAEQQGKLRRITKTVDPSWEPGCLIKWIYQALPAEQRFGLLFDDVAGKDMPLASAALGASVDTYALALGVERDGLNNIWRRALDNQLKPQVVNEASSQEVVHLGKDANLDSLPIPIWTPGKDAAPYITTTTITRRADNAQQNMSVYRTMVRDQHSVVLNINPGRDGYICAHTYLDQGKPAPVAWVIGAEPVVHFASVANLPSGVDEIALAGGLKSAPIEMVRAKTQDIFVPANAEIIIEGEILPNEMADEGPFGEFAGYMGSVAPKPVVRITAITHRRDPIYYGLASQMPPSESTTIQSLSNAPLILYQLREELGESSVTDVSIDLTFGGGLAHGIVAMRPEHPGHAKEVAQKLIEHTALKRITMVDDFVDIRNPQQLSWALNSHYHPSRDTQIFDEAVLPLDPTAELSVAGLPKGSKIIVDATQTRDAGLTSLPTMAHMEKALETWRTAGLPDFEIPAGLRKMLERP